MENQCKWVLHSLSMLNFNSFIINLPFNHIPILVLQLAKTTFKTATMNLTIIAAMAKGRVIGKDNDLIWHLPDDLKHFKNLTKGHHVIMGRKTYESMGKPLPGRTNIVITRQKDFKADGCILVNNIEEGIQKAEGDSQPFIIGGGEIYKQALKYAQTMELTEVNGEFDGDTFFPTFDEKQWKEVSRTHHPVDEKHKYSFDFIQYSKL